MPLGITVYATVIALTIIILLWWRLGCTSHFKFPTRGHVLLLFIGSFIPIYNISQIVVIICFYFGLRISGELELKKNKFNKFWFDKE